MYQFDFVQMIDEDTEGLVIAVMASNYKEATAKVRALGLPGFDLTDYKLEGVYETGTIIPLN